MQCLVIEDELRLREQLRTRLKEEGYAVEAAATGEDGLFLGREFDFDIAVIDLGLPGLSGLDVIRSLRAQQKNFPILILTARSRWQEKVEGLEAGADDYLTKPFEVEELLARLRALVRRSAGAASPLIKHDPLTLDTSKKQLLLDHNPVSLTSYEYKVIEYLILHHSEVISKTQLTEHIYEQDFDRDSNTIEVFVKRLRKKLDPEQTLKPIETVRGQGYRFTLPRNG